MAGRIKSCKNLMMRTGIPCIHGICQAVGKPAAAIRSGSAVLFKDILRHGVICMYAFLIAGCITILGTSCEKEHNPALVSHGIIVGNYGGMDVDSTVRSIDAPYNGFEEILLDPDQNDTADLRLLVVMYGSPGMGIHYKSELQPMNPDMALYGISTSDTTFVHEKVLNYSDDYNIYKSITDYFSCHQYNPDDQVTDIRNAFHILSPDYNDKLTLSDSFVPDTVSFIYHWQSPVLSYVENDTVYYRSSQYEFDCYTVPYGKAIYLAFKLSSRKGERLGWIRIILQSESSMTLTEWAIQKSPD